MITGNSATPDDFELRIITHSGNPLRVRVIDPDHTLEMTHFNTGDIEAPLAFSISGSFTRSLLSAAFLTYLARGVMSSFNFPLNNLNQTSKSLMSVTPLIPAMIMPIPMTWLVHQYGGKYEVLLMMCTAGLGMLLLSVLSAYTDLTTLDSIDWRYLLVLTSAFLIGNGSAASHLSIDVFKWPSDKQFISRTQIIYSFIMDSSSVTTPLIIYYSKANGYFWPFISFTGLLTLAIYGVLAFFQPSPYNQFKTVFSKEKAKILAIEYGQIDKSIGYQDKKSLTFIVKENLRVLCDRRALPLNFALLTSLASSSYTRFILPNVLVKGFAFNPDEAVITSALSYLLMIIARILAEYVIHRWDKKSGGVKTHVMSSIAMIIGALILCSPTPPRWALYLGLTILNISCGFILVTPPNIATAWSKPRNEKLEEFNPSIMFSLFGTIGYLGSITLPLFLGLMVDEGGQDGYQYYYFIIISLMLISAITVPIVHNQVTDSQSNGLIASSMRFFSQQPAPNPHRQAIETDDVHTNKHAY